MMAAVSVDIEPVSREAFAPFGRVLETPGRAEDASGPGWRWWGEMTTLATDGRAWTIGWLDLRPSSAEFDWAERHMRSPEGVVATTGDLFVYVAPPEHPEEPDRLPPLDRFRVFRVPAGTGVVLDPGVWHGAPLAEAETTAMVLLLEGTGKDDVSVVRFEDTPVTVRRAEAT
jgi:ureidoglycolate lyase